MNKPQINKTAIAKFVAGSVVGTGVGFIVKEIIHNNVGLPENSRYQQVAVITGSVVIGMMAKDASKTYVSAKIDETVASYEEIVSKIKDAKTDSTDSE